MGPLSITAGAVGILSFGITICQGLMRYYGSWKDYPKEIKTLCQYLERVMNIMRNLQICISNYAFPAASKEQVESSIQACSSHISVLFTMLKKFEGAMPLDGHQNSLISLIQRAQYPFKERLAIGTLGIDSLGSLNCKAESILIELVTASQGINTIDRNIQSLQIATEQVQQALPAICKNTASLVSNIHTVGEDLAEINQHIQRYEPLLMLLPLIQENLEMLPSRIASSSSLMLKDHASEQDLLQLGTSMNMVKRFSTLEQEIKHLQLRYISKPSLLQEELDSIDNIDNTSDSHGLPSKIGSVGGGVTGQYSKLKMACTCRNVYKSCSSWPAMRVLQITTKTLKGHRNGCPLFSSVPQSQTDVLAARAVCGSFLMKAFEVSISLTRGAGGFSLAPSLTLRTLLRDDSPAFQLFNETHPFHFAAKRGLSAAFVAHMEDSLQKLKILYSEGRASPNDVNSRGMTVLDLATNALMCGSGDGFETEQQLLIGRRNLLLGIAILGVPVNTTHFWSGGRRVESALGAALCKERWFSQIPPTEQVFSSLYEFGTLSGPEEFPYYPLLIFRLIGDLPEYMDFYDCGVLSSTILARSSIGFEKTLNKYPEIVNEKKKLSQTPLHLSAKWPWATSRLLAAGAVADSEDNSGLFPIDYASEFDDLASLAALLAADSHVDFPSSSDIKRVVGNAKAKKSRVEQRKFDLLHTALADRRIRLADLAKKTLLLAEFAQLVASSSGLLDGRAEEVYQRIKDTGNSVPSALKVRRGHGTVFHHPCLTSSQFERLYDGGFRDIDCLNNEQKTPLMSAARRIRFRGIYVVQWLILKGADPMKRVNLEPVVQLSDVSVAMSNWTRQKLKYLHGHGMGSYSETSDISDLTFADLAPGLELLSRNSQTLVGHSCRCLCSQRSCTPFSLFLQHTWWLVRTVGFKESRCRGGCQSQWKDPRRTIKPVSTYQQTCLRAYRYTLSFFADWILRTIYRDQEIPGASFDEIIRNFLFSELELTHTCCHVLGIFELYRFFSRHDDEVREIQEEEEEIIRELDALCTEANALLFPALSVISFSNS